MFKHFLFRQIECVYTLFILPQVFALNKQYYVKYLYGLL